MSPGRRRHRHGPPWGMHGLGMPRGPRARRGDVRAAILALLAEQPRNGYQLMQEIERRSEGAWRPSPGSIYPALQQLVDEGLVREEAAEGRKAYALTDAGRAEQAERGEDAPWAAARDDPDSAGWELVNLVRQLGMTAMQVAQTGSEAQSKQARKVLTDARRALYEILASEDEPT